MSNRTNALFRNTVILGVGQFIPKIVALVVLPLMTMALNTSDYGIYDIVLSAESLFMPLLTLQIQQAIFRKSIQYGKEERKKYVSSGYFFLILSYVLWCPCLLFFLTAVFKASLINACCIYLYYIVYASYDTLGQTVRGIGKNSVYSLGIIGYSLINLVFILGLYSKNGLNIKSIFLASTVAYIITIFYYIFSGKIYLDMQFKSFSKSSLYELLHYSIPIIPSSVSLWIVNLSDRMLITFFLGSSYNGIYAVANKIPNLIASVYSVFNLAWTETAARAMEHDNDADSYYSVMFDVMLRGLTGMLLILMSCAVLIFDLLINEKFSEAFVQIPILFVGVFLNSIVSFFGGLYIAKQKTKQVGYSSIAGALINILINLILINKYRLYAASLSTVISFGIIVVFRAINIKKIINIKYDLSHIMLCATAITVYAFLCKYRSVGIFIVTVTFAILFNLTLNKNEIRKILFIVKERLHR